MQHILCESEQNSICSISCLSYHIETAKHLSLHDILQELLRKSWEQFPGNSQELVLKNFLLEIPKNFHKFCRHFLRFFCRIGKKKFPGIGYKKFLGLSYENFLGIGYKKFLEPGSLEWVTRNSSEQLSTFSPDFLVKEFQEFPLIFRKIVTWRSSSCSLFECS